MFDKVLIANRGEIALRIIRGCRDLGVRTVAVHSEVDRTAAFVLLADEAVEIGPAPAAQSYLVIDRIIDAARVDRRAGDPSRVRVSQREPAARAGVRGERHRLRRPAARRHGGDGREGARARAHAQLRRPGRPGDGCARRHRGNRRRRSGIGYPVLIKASAGGGGIGMRVARDEEELRALVRHREEHRAARLRQRHDLSRALPRGAAPHRDPGAGGHARQRHPPRRARVLDPAPPPEDRRGSAVAGHRRGDPRAHGRGGGDRRARRSATSTPEPSSSSIATASSISWR